MPGGKTHLAIGVGTALALGATLPLNHKFPLMLGATVVVCSFGALAPDLDIPDNELEETGRNQGQSLARRLRNTARNSDRFDRIFARFVGSLLLFAGEIVSRVLETVAWLIQSVTTHRGMTHTVLATIFTTGLAVLASQKWTNDGAWWGIAWGAGYVSHLVADSWTWSGVRFLLPFSDRRFWLIPRFLRFRVGTWRDKLLRYASLFAGAAFFVWQSRVLERFVLR